MGRRVLPLRARAAPNQSQGVDLRRDGVRDDGLAALWREADGEEDFLRGVRALQVLGTGGNLSVEKIRAGRTGGRVPQGRPRVAVVIVGRRKRRIRRRMR